MSTTPTGRERRGDQYLVAPAWGGGLWSDIATLAAQLLLAEISGRQPVIYWGENSLYQDEPGRNVFTDLFQPLPGPSLTEVKQRAASAFPTTEITAPNTPDVADKWRRRLSPIQILGRGETVVEAEFQMTLSQVAAWAPPDHWSSGRSVLEVAAHFLRRLTPLHPILEEVERLVSLFPGRPMLAAHLRNLDRVREQGDLMRHNLMTQDRIDAWLREYPDGGVFLLTDSQAMLERVTARHGKRVAHSQASRSPDERFICFLTVHRSRLDLGKEILIDTYTALKCDAFAGSGMSGVAASIAILKDWPSGALFLEGGNLLAEPLWTFYDDTE